MDQLLLFSRAGGEICTLVPEEIGFEHWVLCWSPFCGWLKMASLSLILVFLQTALSNSTANAWILCSKHYYSTWLISPPPTPPPVPKKKKN